MLRRALAPIFLAFALLFVQQAGLAHELSHYARGSSQPDKQSPHSQVCDQCAAYAQVGGGAVSQSFAVPPPQGASSPIVFSGVVHTAPHFLTQRSRAPPFLA